MCGVHGGAVSTLTCVQVMAVCGRGHLHSCSVQSTVLLQLHRCRPELSRFSMPVMSAQYWKHIYTAADPHPKVLGFSGTLSSSWANSSTWRGSGKGVQW